MEAVAFGRVPRCEDCGGEGVVLDRHMRGDVLGGVHGDVTRVADWCDWGLVVTFGCGCCHGGFSYVESAPGEAMEMQVDA